MGSGQSKGSRYEDHASPVTQISKLVAKQQRKVKTVYREVIDPPSFKNMNFASNSTYIEALEAEIFPFVEKSRPDKDQIISALNSHFSFTSLNDDDKEAIAKAMLLYKFTAGNTVFEQNKPAMCYYILKEGLLRVSINGKAVNTIEPGQGFGEFALIHTSMRPARVDCLTDALLWGIERSTFRKVIEDMNIQVYEQNRDFLERVSLLQSLTSGQKDALAVSLVPIKYQAGQKIISEGEEGDHLFIIKSGLVSVQKNGLEIARLEAGGYFGEKALLKNTRRSASCIAINGPVLCLVLSRDIVQSILENKLKDIIEFNTIMEAINQSKILSSLNYDQKISVASHLKFVTYKAGDIIFLGGSKKLYIVIYGKMQSAKGSNVIAEKGACIGDLFVTTKKNEEKIQDMIASTDLKIGELLKFQFEACIGGKFEDALEMNEAISILKKVQLFRYFDFSQLRNLVTIMERKRFAPGTVLLNQNERSEHLFIIKRGRVNVYKEDRRFKTMVKLDYFGETSLLYNGISKLAYVASSKVSLWTIPIKEFLPFVNKKMQKQLVYRMELEDDNVELEDLNIVKQLGSGDTSKMFLVQSFNRLYALKVVFRSDIAKYRLKNYLIQEREILHMTDHHFITKLVKNFQDSSRIYFLYEFVNGLELSSILEYTFNFSNHDSQFYVACLIQTLQYLHERHIIYRDLKPENIVIDNKGYPKLAKFVYSKIEKNKTYTVVGSPHYMAPEAIIGKGYDHTCDWWSLGIIAYEFLCGEVPFAEHEQNPYEIYNQILHNNLDFDTHNGFLVDYSINFLKKLLVKNPSIREWEHLDKSDWFIGFDWDALCKRTLVPPFRPDVGEEELDNNGQSDLKVFMIEKTNESLLEENLTEELDIWENWF